MPPDRYITPASPPEIEGESSLLDEETPLMERQRRLALQAQLRKLAKLHAREHKEGVQHGSEQALDNGMKQHPYHDSQKNDGIHPGLNPEPPLSSPARLNYDNELRDQTKEKQNRLEQQLGLDYAPGRRTAPEFKP